MEQSDFLVIGSGIAGLIYALNVADYGKVLVLSKSDPCEGSTKYAQGGIASVVSPKDTFESHIEDTMVAGAGLCHKDVVEMVVEQGPKLIEHLVELGTHFDLVEDSEQQYKLGREGGHSKRRILHSADTTGAEIQRALYERANKHPNIKFYEQHLAIDLILNKKSKEPEALGAYVLSKTKNKIIAFSARTTMLATGGTGKVYLYTSNPDVATGDGIAIAYRAGARVVNMEFIQFHPTCLFHSEAKSFLLTEALRGEGAQLLLRNGKRFMQEYHTLAELAPRDIVARAIDEQMKKTGDDYVLLNISHKDPNFIKDRFPNIYRTLLKYNYDLTKDPIPIVPAAHYCCGGVMSFQEGLSDIARLYVAGETAFTGLHGANRLASNSLLEALVFAYKAAKHTIKNLPYLSMPQQVPEWDYLNTTKSKEEVLLSHTWDEVRRLMWNLVGIVRSNKRLTSAKQRIALIKKEIEEYYWNFHINSDLIELRNIILVAELIIESASQRKESRGLHYNTDYPNKDDKRCLCDTVLSQHFSPHV